MSEGAYNILLIEDSRTQAVRIEALLENEGWNVRWVPSGEDALDALCAFPPDLILVDYHLPGMRGDALCRQIRMRIDTRLIAVIMLTVDDSREIEARGLESGADDFVRKAAEPEQIILRVRTLLRRARTHTRVLDPSERTIRRQRVLAIDDSPTFLAHLAEQLGDESYELETETDALHALHRVRHEHFDCVLIDWTMPEIDGIELARRIQSMPFADQCRPAMLLLTAREDSADPTHALDAGADDFVGKQSDTSVLKVRIRALLRRKYFEEENSRILAELRDKQLQVETARIEKEAAEARAGLADQLERTTQGLRETNADLERFAYVAAHDLQEPLRMVASYLQLLEAQIGADLGQTEREYLAYSVNGARRLKALIGDLFEYSRIIAHEHRPMRTDATSLVDKVCAEMRARCERAGATIQRDELPTLVLDPILFEVLVRQLLDNALKFRSSRETHVRIEAAEHDKEWILSVSDNGIGIDPAFENRVFVIFQRLHTQDEYPGTGAGLAICKRIVERHGGRIWIEPTPDGGTTVRFTISKQQRPLPEEIEYAHQEA